MITKRNVASRAMYLLAAGKAALHLDDLFKTQPRPLEWAVRQQMLDVYLSFVHLYHRGGGDLKPKHHQLVHMLQKCNRHGNPRFYQTYRDESLNGLIAKIAASCHFNSFQSVVHFKFAIMQKLNMSMEIH